MIGDELKLKDQILKCSENRDVKDTRKFPLTTVIIYEAPYELEDMHIYRVLSKYGDIKGNINRHKHKRTNIENGNRSVVFNDLPRNIHTVLWVNVNKIKIRYEGQNREAICSYCHQKGHYKKICLKMIQDKEDEETWRREQEEEEAERRRNEEEEKERERINRDKSLEMMTNERILDGIKEREEKEKKERNIQLQRQEEEIRQQMTNTQLTTATTVTATEMTQNQQQQDSEEMESDNSIPCNQQAYANATKQNNLTEKERKEKEKQRKRKEEDRKRIAEIKRNDKLREHEQMSMIELQKLLHGRREKEVKGNE